MLLELDLLVLFKPSKLEQIYTTINLFKQQK